MKAEDRAEKVVTKMREKDRYTRRMIGWDGSWDDLECLLVDEIRRAQAEKSIWEETVKHTTAKLCSTIHDLLGPFDGRDPATDMPMYLEVRGEHIRKAQAVLAEVE